MVYINKNFPYFVACVASVSVVGKGEKIEKSFFGLPVVQQAELGGGGEEREKETLANKPRVFENRPFDLSRLSAHVKMTSVKFCPIIFMTKSKQICVNFNDLRFVLPGYG